MESKANRRFHGGWAGESAFHLRSRLRRIVPITERPTDSKSIIRHPGPPPRGRASILLNRICCRPPSCRRSETWGVARRERLLRLFFYLVLTPLSGALVVVLLFVLKRRIARRLMHALSWSMNGMENYPQGVLWKPIRR